MSEVSKSEERLVPELEDCLGRLPGGATAERRSDGIWMTAPTLDVSAMAELMRRLEARLSAMSGLALPDGETGLLYHFCLGHLPINIRTQTRGRAISSIAPVIRAADWAEREIADLYGVRFDGHPNPGRLIRPPSLSVGFFRESEAEGGRGEKGS